VSEKEKESSRRKAFYPDLQSRFVLMMPPPALNTSAGLTRLKLKEFHLKHEHSDARTVTLRQEKRRQDAYALQSLREMEQAFRVDFARSGLGVRFVFALLWHIVAILCDLQ
jgi:hypothetical protein